MARRSSLQWAWERSRRHKRHSSRLSNCAIRSNLNRKPPLATKLCLTYIGIAITLCDRSQHGSTTLSEISGIEMHELQRQMIESELVDISGREYVLSDEADRAIYGVDYFWVPRMFVDRGSPLPLPDLVV